MKVIKVQMASRLRLWTSRDMTYNNPIATKKRSKGFYVIKKHTECCKATYTSEVKARLRKMENEVNRRAGDRPVAVLLDGLVRYMWRSDVLTEEEYAEVRKVARDKLKLLRKK